MKTFKYAIWIDNSYYIRDIPGDTIEQAKLYIETNFNWAYKNSLYKLAEGKNLGRQTILAQSRPSGFCNLAFREQWDIDKKLGILDWSGNPFE